MENKNIITAAKVGDLENLKYLVKIGKDVNSANSRSRWTPLHMAVYYNREDCVDYLLTLNDIKIDAETRIGETALLLACRHYYRVPSSIVQKLVTAGADVNIVQYDSKSPLYCVCESPSNSVSDYYVDNLRKAEILINNNAQLNISETIEGNTPLFAAIEEQNFDLVTMLLYAGADANLQRDFEECTPLIIAARTDNYDIVKTLLPFVVDVNVTSLDGCTALMLAQDDRIIKLLLNHGADSNIIAIDKPITAVHLAAFRHNLSKLKLLLPHTKDSVICSCDQYNLVSLITESIEGHHNLAVAFDCLRYLLSSEVDNSVYFVPFSYFGRFYPPIVALFIPCVLTASEDLWNQYIGIFYLFLSKGINVNLEKNQLHLLFAFLKIYNKWSPRLSQILDILVDLGLNADSFLLMLFLVYFCNVYPVSPNECDISMVMYLIPYWLRNSAFFQYCLDRKSEKDGLSPVFYELFGSGSLKSCCRSVIRKQLKITCKTTSDFLRAIRSLEIPQSLKDYIRFKFY